MARKTVTNPAANNPTTVTIIRRDDRANVKTVESVTFSTPNFKRNKNNTDEMTDAKRTEDRLMFVFVLQKRSKIIVVPRKANDVSTIEDDEE